MGPFLESMTESLGVSLLNFGYAALILVVGWIIALVVSAGVRRLLQSTSIDNRLAAQMGAKESFNIEGILAKVVFWIIMLFAIIAALNALRLTAVSRPLNSMLDEVFSFLPNLAAAAVLAFVAWVVATILRFIVSRVLGATRIDDRLASNAGLTDEGRQVPLSETLASIIYWFVLLLFVPAILDALELEGLLAPIQGMVDDLLGFVPNIFAAAIILFIGYFIARIIRQIVTGLLAAVGADRLGERVGLSAAIGQQSLSNVIGLIVYVLILIPVIIAALDALDIAAISVPATNMLNTLLDAIPNIFGAMIILAVAYFIGRLVSNLVTTLLTSVGFDRVLNLIGIRGATEADYRSPSAIIGYLVLIGIMLFATVEAAELLGFGIIAVLISEFLIFAGQVILAIIVLGLGLYLANLARSIILSTAGDHANFLAQVARIAIIVISAAMALRQMDIAEDIVNLAFGLSLGAIAVAVALAFGLGAREIAGREVASWLESFRSEEETKKLPPAGTTTTASK